MKHKKLVEYIPFILFFTIFLVQIPYANSETLSFTATSLTALEETGATSIDRLSRKLAIAAIILPPSTSIQRPAFSIGIEIPTNFDRHPKHSLSIPFFTKAQSGSQGEKGWINFTVEGKLIRAGKIFKDHGKSDFVRNIKVEAQSSPKAFHYYVAKAELEKSVLKEARPGDLLYLKISRDDSQALPLNKNFIQEIRAVTSAGMTNTDVACPGVALEEPDA